MKIVLWIGNEPNQKALAHKINEIIPLTGIVTETRAPKLKITISILFEKFIEKIFISSINNAWWRMKSHFNQLYPSYPEVDLIDVENINSQKVYDFTLSKEPDLILVSGTRIVKELLLSINPSIGILNLHTGLSPYIKGGPNCTNWCIATKQYHLIGNTIMWMDLGIDSGNILTTEFTNIQGTENLDEIHLKVMNHAHSLYIKAIKSVESGDRTSVSQSSISKGKTYYTKDWTLVSKMQVIYNTRNMKAVFKSGEVDTLRKQIKVVNI